MFPDSLLENEKFDLLDDKTHTNSIHKIYICKMSGVRNIRTGDIIVIYRTKDRKFQAKWRSVVRLADQQFKDIVKEGQADESLIID
jgi:hypothetical protein